MCFPNGLYSYSVYDLTYLCQPNHSVLYHPNEVGEPAASTEAGGEAVATPVRNEVRKTCDPPKVPQPPASLVKLPDEDQAPTPFPSGEPAEAVETPTAPAGVQPAKQEETKKTPGVTERKARCFNFTPNISHDTSSKTDKTMYDIL